MSFLVVRFEVGGVGRGKTTPFLKLVRIMLETWNLVRKVHTYIVSENIPFSTKAFLILLMSAAFCKKMSNFGNNDTFNQSNSVRAVLEIF